MPVPFFDLTRQDSRCGRAVRERVAAVFDSQKFILGPEVEAFENEFAAAIGVPHAVGMSSGTDAELALLMALGFGPGDAVLTTPFTFFATAGCLARLGIEPVFCDIEPGTFHLNTEWAARWIRDRCRPGPQGLPITPAGNTLRAAMPVHLFGLAADMDAVDDLAGEFGLIVIEDAAQAVGAVCPGRGGQAHAGAWSGRGFFSFFPTKNLGGAGDGGMVVCCDGGLAERLRRLRNHGMSAQYLHEETGGNFRLDALQAAVLRAKLPFLAGWNAARRSNAALYLAELKPLEDAGWIRLPPASGEDPRRHVWHQFVIRAARRDALRAHLTARGIGTAVYYPLPLHRQPCFQRSGGGVPSLPEAERAAREVLALPIFPELEEEEIRGVCAAIREFFAGGD